MYIYILHKKIKIQTHYIIKTECKICIEMFSTYRSKVKSDPNISKLGTAINVDFILHMGSDGSFTVFSEWERPETKLRPVFDYSLFFVQEFKSEC